MSDGTGNPWKTLGSRIAYRNAWITVREDQVIRPDGNPGIYGVVETRRALGIVALTPDRQVYLVGQYRYPTRHYSWEIIEGGSEGQEPPIETARRELREEGGLLAQRWLQLGDEFHLSNCHSDEVAYAFLASGLSEVPASPEGTEILQLRKMPFEDALTMVYSGEIKDGLSIIGLQRAERFLSQGGVC